jgi:hypothetical protein
MLRLKRLTRGLALACAGAACGAAAGCLFGLWLGVLLLAAGGKGGAVLNASLLGAAAAALTGAVLGAFGSLDEEGFVADVAALWRRSISSEKRSRGPRPAALPREQAAGTRLGSLARLLRPH